MTVARGAWAGSAIAIFVFVLLFAAGAAKPFHLDNMDFPAVAAATAVSGLPVYYRGEEALHWSGLYHPPLYIYTLAAWIRVFGSTEAPIRLFGMTCALLQGVVVLLMVRTLFGAGMALRWMPLFWALFLLNPYTIQTASIADIDSTIYGPLLCLVLLAALRASWKDGEWRTDRIRRQDYLWVAVALYLCFWAKLTTVWLVIPIVFLLWISRLGVVRAAVATVVVSAAALLLFVVSYELYGALTGLDVNYTFRFTWESFAKRGTSAAPGLMSRVSDMWRNLLFMILFTLRWTGLLPWVAALGALAFAARNALARDRRYLHYGLVLALAFVSTWYYCAKVATYGYSPYKYDFVYWGLILTAPLFVIECCGEYRWTWKIAAGLSVLYAFAALWVAGRVGDALIRDGLAGLYRFIAYIPGLLLAAGLLRTRFRIPLIAAALAAYGGIQLGVAVNQAKAPYATTYDYGQTGFMDTVGFIRANTGPDDIIVSMKDIGYRAHRRYFENYAAVNGDPAAAAHLVDVMKSGRAAYFVFTEGHGQDELFLNPSLQRWVEENCTLVRSYGNYRIYQRRYGAK